MTTGQLPVVSAGAQWIWLAEPLSCQRRSLRRGAGRTQYGDAHDIAGRSSSGPQRSDRRSGALCRRRPLDRAITRALTELSRALPSVQEATLRTTADSRRVDLSGLSGLWDVEAVEWPTGAYPRRWRRFELAPDKQSVTLLVTAPPAAAEDVLVQWAKGHTLDGLDGATSTTIPEECAELLLLGAYGFAAWAYSTPAADNFRYQDGAQFAQVDDSMIAPEWRGARRVRAGDLPGAAGRLAAQPGWCRRRLRWCGASRDRRHGGPAPLRAESRSA